jgi:hypothetical protein
MRTFHLAALVIGCAIVSSAQAMLPKPVKPGEEEWRKPIVAALDQVINLDFNNMKVTEAIDFFATNAKKTFITDLKAFPKDKPPTVTLKLNNVKMKDALQQTMAKAGLEHELRDGAVFIFNKATLDKEMLRPDDMHAGRLLDGRAEMLSVDFIDTPAGSALEQLTKEPGITLAVEDAIKKVPVSLKLKEIGLGNAIRWVVRFAGAKIVVDVNGMRVTKR